jgi:Xaa-Pro aminopeptidase
MGDQHEARQARRARLGALIAEREADAALITRLVNVRYLTGLASSNAALLVWADGSALLATDSRYAGTAAKVAPDLTTVIERTIAPRLVETAAEAGVKRLAVEAHDITVERFAELAARDHGTELPPLGHAVEELRMVKDDAEIALLTRACEITDAAFQAVLPLLRPGVTEREIAIALERHMVDLGAERPAFDSIVAAGPNGAIPHHEPTDRPLERGDLVTMDFGARYGGYHADMTRTVGIGTLADWQQDLYDLVRTAQQNAVNAALPDAEYKDVDAAARDLITEAGHGEDFAHGLGHGVGLEIHESPFFGPNATGRLVDRVPITSEPGVYLAQRGGVRIEDTLVVRAGGPELLTKTAKELLVL